ncbi:MAG TPA: hypothetical protein DCQ08_02585 [Amoebophilaceae bacterium]|nr:hypothetical protein [Amoebophilaceae bacterium]
MEDKLIKQHNFLTTARYEMSALEKNIVYMLIAQLDDVDPWGAKYEVSIRTLQEKKGVRVRRERALSAAKKLISRGITIYHEDQKEFISIAILSSANYGQGDKKDYLILEFDRKLFPFLVNLKQRFTIYRLQAALELKSKYSKRMYEMLSQFKDTGIMRTSLKELKTRLGLIDVDTGEERYTEFKLFTGKVLDVAQRELAQHTEILFSYTARKTGKKYTDLEFKISYAPLLRESKKANTPTQNVSVESISSSPKKEKYPYPDLKGEALGHYLRLTRELGWLDKKTAYKVVTSIPILHLGNHIDRLYFNIRAGKARDPSEFFKALLAEKNGGAKSFEINKKSEKKEIFPDAEASIRGVCCRKLAIEFDVDLFMISRISTQMTPNTLRDFLDKISEEITHTEIPEGAKGNYLLKRLKEEFKILL